MSNSSEICAVVVTYFPDDSLESLVETLSPQVKHLIVIDNSADTGVRTRLNLFEQANLKVLFNEENLGLGRALNQGLEQAQNLNSDYLLSLDQDSQLYPNTVELLVHAIESAEPSTALMAANYVHKKTGAVYRAPTESPSFPVTTALTSGNLVRCDALVAIGGFNESFFIDQLDHDLCLRLGQAGYQIRMTSDALMCHAVGETNSIALPILGEFPRHSAERKYYIARNCILLFRQQWRNYPFWCFKRLTKMLLGICFTLLFEQPRLEKFRAAISGVHHGLRGRMGKKN